MRFLRLCSVLAPFFFCALVGCRSEEGIHTETVTHPDRQWLRLRVAILERGDTIWFIRIDGPEEQVALQKDAFEGFVKSTEFSEKKDDPEPLKWKVPDGWKKDPSLPGMLRYAAFRIDAKPTELEVKITKLPRKESWLMENMHRWQKQMDVKLSEFEADNKLYLKVEAVGQQQITWVDIKGLGVHTVSKAPDPDARRSKDFLGGQPFDKEGKVPFKYAAPVGWAKKPPGEFAVDAYVVTDGKSSAEVTLTSAMGDLAMNINRWRGQVGLQPLAKNDLLETIKPLDVAGVKSLYVDIPNPDGPPKRNRILGVIVPHGQSKWFIKMTGPHEFVGQHKKAFEAFVESFKK